MRKISYVTGTRADFGLMKNTLEAIHQHPGLSLSLFVTGMHLLKSYGETCLEIENTGLPIAAKISVDLTGSHSGAEMAYALGEQIIGFTRALQDERPDVLLLLGDRGEMLAGAIAALHLNIPIAHIHGGELSGTVDESIRHAISKLSHYHFTSTEKSCERLIRMGEKADHIVVTGAPGIDEVFKTQLVERAVLFSALGLDTENPLLLILFHPIVQQAAEAAKQVKELLEAAVESAMQVLVIMPNADAGSHSVRKVIDDFERKQQVKTAIHVPRHEYLSLISYADVMAGNSSSGIIEAASLGTPVVNVGDRQRCRERNANVIDVHGGKREVLSAILRAKNMKGLSWKNIYGKGKSTELIVAALLDINLDPKILEKVNAY